MCSWGDGSRESLLPGGGVIPIRILGVSSNELDKEEGRGDCVSAGGRWDVWHQRGRGAEAGEHETGGPRGTGTGDCPVGFGVAGGPMSFSGPCFLESFGGRCDP